MIKGTLKHNSVHIQMSNFKLSNRGTRNVIIFRSEIINSLIQKRVDREGTQEFTRDILCICSLVDLNSKITVNHVSWDQIHVHFSKGEKRNNPVCTQEKEKNIQNCNTFVLKI